MTHKLDEKALAPCPFCGGEATAETVKDAFENARFEVCCTVCPAEMGWHVDAQDWSLDLDAEKLATIDAWNRRAAAPLARAGSGEHVAGHRYSAEGW